LQNSEYNNQPSLAQIGVTPELHAALAGAGMGIANIDGYPDLAHPDLAGNVTVIRMFGLMSQYDLKGSWAMNHATHVVGIMAGLKNGSGIVGVAPQARVYDYPIWSETGTWTAGAVSNLKRVYDNVRALNAAGANISVINQEFQFARYQSGAYLLEGVFATGELYLMDDYRDLVFVRAAGNQGKILLNQNYQLGAAANLNHLLLVGSVNSSNVISTFSNRPGERCFYKIGETVCREEEKLKNFFVVAPGDGILSSIYGPTTQKWYGTSMAAPHVAAEVALIAQDAKNKNVKLTAPQLAAIVKESAKDLGTPGVDGVYGWGLINVKAALAPIGPLAPAVVEGQVSFDKFGRPYEVSPTPVAVAPQTSSWQTMMMGESQTLALQDGLSLTTRQAIEDDRSSLAMTGLQKQFGQFAFGLSAGALSETSSLLGNVSDDSHVTRLASVDASWSAGNWKLGAFYAQGRAGDFAANAYGIGASYRSLRLDIVKPLSIISATVPTGLNLDGSVAYATLPGERPWAAMLTFKREF
jgi:hypothetical protein